MNSAPKNSLGRRFLANSENNLKNHVFNDFLGENSEENGCVDGGSGEYLLKIQN